MKTFILLFLAISLGLRLQGISSPLFISKPVQANVEALLTPTPTPSKTEVISYIAKTFEPEGTSTVVKAINCFYSESGLRWDAKSLTSDSGVAQINQVHKMGDKAFDYRANIDKAYQIYKRSGWNPWYGKGCV